MTEKEIFLLLFNFIKQRESKDAAMCKVMKKNGFEVESIYLELLCKLEGITLDILGVPKDNTTDKIYRNAFTCNGMNKNCPCCSDESYIHIIPDGYFCRDMRHNIFYSRNGEMAYKKLLKYKRFY